MAIIFILEMIFIISIPYIIGGILVGIIIWLIRTRLIKSKILKTLIIITILLFGCIILSNFKDERPDDLCAEMNEINHNQSLIGLSKEEVIQLLGEPEYESHRKNMNDLYQYDAGSLDRGLFWGTTTIFFDSSYGCKFNVAFDENDKVKSTSIQYVD